MIDKSLDIIYNKKYLVIVPYIDRELYNGFRHSFQNVILMKNTVDEVNKTIEFINKNNFGQLIFVDFQIEYEQVINNLINKHEIKLIFTKSLGALSDEFTYYTFKGLYKIYEEKIATKIGFLDKGLYEVFKNKGENVEYICLDIERKKATTEYDEKSIGLINDQNNSRHSFYNELSAIKLAGDYYVTLNAPNKTTNKFIKLFKIKNKKSSSINKNLVNLYINFTANNNLVFIESMDSGVPCILGNNNILDNNLSPYLSIKSDDDINEIAEKINFVKKNRAEIMKKYEQFREEYSKKSKESVEKFLGEKVEELDINKSSEEILLSVIVPVYNTEEFLEKSLESIIDSEISKMEIIIINDGSKDNSEKIALKYQKKYPKLIRYISQENHGLGNVRNVGLKEARGKYIASVDSDDTININFFSEAIKYMENDIDVIMCDWLTVTNESEYETTAIDYVFNNISRYEGLLYTTIMPSTCNKIIKKSLFDELDINYIEDKFEDLSTNPFIMLKAKTIKYINQPYYEYYIRSNSIMRTKPGYSMIDILNIVNDRLEKYKEHVNIDIDKFKYYTFAWRIEEYIINQLYTIDEEEIKTFTEYLKENFKEVFEGIFTNIYYIEKINSLSPEMKKYIESRNEAIKNNKLDKFIKESRKNKNYYVLTPPIMYYGEN